MRACTSAYAFFAVSANAFTGIFEHHACTGVYVRQMVNINVHICFTLAAGCAYVRMYVQFVSFSIGERGWAGLTSL